MIKKFLWSWLPLVLGGTVIFLVIYVCVQQSYRQNANDPQIELVENAIPALAAGYPVKAVFANMISLDMAETLSMFVMIFDESGQLVDSSVTYNDAPPPIPPQGVFDYTREQGENRITWETASGLRFATVIDHYQNGTSSSGFLLAARSLREVEIRENNLSWMIFLGWLAFIVVTAASVFVSAMMKPLSGVELTNQ